MIENGALTRKRVCKRLASVCDLYRSVGSVRPLAEEILGPLNAGKLHPESTQTVTDFIEHCYLPYCKQHKRPSTHKGYVDIFENHLKNRLTSIRLRDFRCVNGERLLTMISNQSRLSHASLKHIKSFLSGAFVCAKRRGALDGENPMRDVGIPAGAPSKETYAYTLEEVQVMMRLVPEPARTVIATAAFSGLTKSELRGVRWDDFAGDEIFVSRAIWGTHIGEPKTAARKASVPVIPQLIRALTEHGQRYPRGEYVFVAGNGAPLNLDNLVTRIIRPALKNSGISWHGWHAFRRGLATNLHRLGVPDKTIQGILRHANVSTTQAHYILNSSADAHNAMQRLETAVANKWQTPAKQYVS